jgi:hypothetical protein
MLPGEEMLGHLPGPYRGPVSMIHEQRQGGELSVHDLDFMQGERRHVDKVEPRSVG